jgi:sugar phosphate isomerase/epimerase
MVGIYDCFGYGGSFDVPFEERYRLIKQAGFDCVMLWWSDKFGRGTGYQEDVCLARKAGLNIENMHTPVHEQNCLSSDNLDGESVYQTYLRCVEDCAAFHIPTMVIHLPDDQYPVNELGLQRLEKIIHKAEEEGVQVAFENLKNINNLDTVLNTFQSKFAGYCYDSCHHQNYASDMDLLGKYRNRLMALHLQDNGGKHNQHQLPFDGNIDWEEVMKKITLTGYQGATTLEPMNWDYEDLSIQEFLDCAYQKAKELDGLRNL